MRYYPVFLDLAGRRCLVVGQGKLAGQKAAQLAAAGARVIEAPSFDEEAAAGAWLIVAEADDPVEIARMREYSDARQIPLNVIDKPDDCSFIAPAIHEQADLVIAVSTSGKCPALAARIRQDLEQLYGPEYGELLRVLAEIRPLVKRRFVTYDERKAFYQRALHGDLAALVREHGISRVREELIGLMEQEVGL